MDLAIDWSSPSYKSYVRDEAVAGLTPRLKNWGIWFRRSPFYGQACSLEGDYRSPQSKHWHPPGPRPVQADAADAWDITLAAATLTIKLHLVLKLAYVVKLQDSEIASVLRRSLNDRTRDKDIPTIDWQARTELLAALASPLVVRRLRAVEKTRQIIAKVEDNMCD